MRTKMTHGFPALDGPTTAKNYAEQVKALSDNSISNLKNEAEELHFRVKYFGDDTAQAFEDLRRSIEDLRDESEMHDDCASSDEISRLEEYNNDLERDLKDMKKRLSNAVYLLEECEKLASGELLEKIKGVIYEKDA